MKTASPLERLSEFDAIIDVRSPAEFAEDHIPGAINCPVLDDAQRAEVGTLYKQVSPFAARKLGAALVSENIARHLREQFIDHPKSWTPLVYCWRGGQRSGSMNVVLRQIGWNSLQLEGGYKAYRRHVVEALGKLPTAFRFHVVCGATGSGKSRILQALAQMGEQVLDLEDLACHKGSVLGVLRNEPQPTQKMFESQLLRILESFDPVRPVFVEAESRKVGRLQVPETLIESIRRSPCITVEASLPARIDFLLRDYVYFVEDVDWLATRLAALRPLCGNETVDRWIERARRGEWPAFIADILENHYDPLYERSQNRNYVGLETPAAVRTADLSEAGIGEVAARIAAWSQAQAVKPRSPAEQTI